MEAILIIVILATLGWIFALEVRFHSLKNIAAESRELATEALDKAHEVVEPLGRKRKS